MAFDPNNPAASGMVLTFDDEFSSSTGQLSADNVASNTKWSDHVWWMPAPSTFPGSIHDGVLDLQPGAEINTINSSAQGWSQKYGYFEARIKFAPSNDVEQGFFMMSQAHAASAPAPSSELDIVETSPHDPTHVLDTLHRESGQPGEAQDSATGGNPIVNAGVDTTAGFHTYSALWDPNSQSMTWYLDGKVTMVQPKYDTTDGAAMFMDLLNTAGTGDMEVDYVRAWQFSSQNPTAVTPDPVSAPFGQTATNGSVLPGASATPTPVPTPGPVSSAPASAEGATVIGTNGTIVSDAHNAFAINAGGQITENGAVMTVTGAVTELVYHNHTLYQEATSQNLWWSFNETSNTWTQTSNPLAVVATPAPTPAPAPVFLSSSFSDGAGHDVFVFNTPAATGKDIANFNANADILDLAPALKAAGYTGSDPIADHVVTLVQSGTDSTAVKIDPTGHDPNHGTTLVTLDHVLPQDVHAANIWH